MATMQTPYGPRRVTVNGEFDETTLKQVAQTTGGEYFRATDNNSLKLIYDQIDKLEKTKMRVREYSKRSENFYPWLVGALLCLILEILIRHFVLRTISQ